MGLPAIALLLILMGATGAALARGGRLAPQIWVGNPPGPATLPGLDAERSRQSKVLLPTAAKLLWQKRLIGPITGSAVVDDHGAIVVAHGNGLLSQLNGQGKVNWKHRLGDAAPASDVVLLSDNSRAIVNADNTLLLISPSGRLGARAATGIKGAIVSLLPTESGGVLVAGTRRVVEIDQGGLQVAAFTLEGRIHQLLGPNLAVLRDGRVFHLSHDIGAELIAQLPGGVRGDVALSAGKLISFGARRELLELDLQTKRSRVLASQTGAGSLLEWLAVSNTRRFVATRDGLLLTLDKDGNERHRIALQPTPSDTSPGLVETLSTPPPFVDPKGRLAIALPGQGVMIFEPEGRGERQGEASCLRPIALLPAGAQRLGLVCHSGELWMLQGATAISDRAPKKSP